MAMCSLRGHLGTEVNTELGMNYLYMASSTSDPDCPQASYVFGLIQLGEIKGVAPPNTTLPETSGIAAMERAAWLGFAPALVRTGMAWQGGEKGYDSVVALRYFHIASRQQQYLRYKGDENAGLGGNAEAEISKWMLCGSEGYFPANEEYAFYFAKLASDLGNSIAEFAVGYFYEVGIYIEQDIQAALIWYGIAASHDSVDAIERLKELNMSRKNTISKKQHTRALTLKGRGSMRHFRRKADTSQSTKGSPYPEPEYPDVLRCSSRNSEAPAEPTPDYSIRDPDVPPRSRRTRVMSESFGPRKNPQAHPRDAYMDGTEGSARRLRKERLSLPANPYAKGEATRLTPPHMQQPISNTQKPKSASPTRQRVASNMLPNPSREQAKNRRTSSPVVSSKQPASFPGSQAFPPLTSVSLATRRPLPSPTEYIEKNQEPAPRRSSMYGNVSLDNSSIPVLPSPKRNTPVAEVENSTKLDSSKLDSPKSESGSLKAFDTGAPTDEENLNENKDTTLPASSKKNRFSVMGMIFGYSSTSPEPPKVDGDSHSITGSLASSSTTSLDKSEEKSEELSRSETSSPQRKWGENAVPRAATMPINNSTAPSYQGSAQLHARARSGSPRKFSPAPERERNNDQGQQPEEHTLDLPPSMRAVRSTSPRAPPNRGSPSPPSQISCYSPSRASTINSTSTSTSAESDPTPASSVSSVRSGSTSPIRRAPTSKVPVIYAVQGDAALRGPSAPKTFEEMGIPATRHAKGDCTIM